MKHARAIYIAFAIFLCESEGESQESLRILNNTNAPKRVFALAESTGQWRAPSLFVPKNQSRHLSVVRGERYYLVVRDEMQRDKPVGGYIDIWTKLKETPSIELKLSARVKITCTSFIVAATVCSSIRRGICDV